MSEEVPQEYAQVIENLKKQLKEKDDELDEMEENLIKAVESIKTFHVQQKELYDAFEDMRGKYNQAKENLGHLLWEYIPREINRYRGFPVLETDSVSNEYELKSGGNMLDDFVVDKVLGEGRIAKVYKCQKKNDTTTTTTPTKEKVEEKETVSFAVKVLKKTRIISLEGLKQVNSEITTLRHLHHPNVVRLLDVHHTPSSIYLVMEYGGIDLFDKLVSGSSTFCFDESATSMTEEQSEYILKTQNIVQQIVSAIHFLHTKNICHRDLKPENILYLEESSSVRIIDFGLAQRLDQDPMLGQFCGSPGFFAPEIVTVGIYNGFHVDMWSIGCILMEFVIGHENFVQSWLSTYTVDIISSADDFAVKIKESLATVMQKAKAMLACMEEINNATAAKTTSSTQEVGDEGTSIPQANAMRVFQDAVNVMQSLLEVNPDTRATAADIIENFAYLQGMKIDHSVQSGSEMDEKAKSAEEQKHELHIVTTGSRATGEDQNISQSPLAPLRFSFRKDESLDTTAYANQERTDTNNDNDEEVVISSSTQPISNLLARRKNSKKNNEHPTSSLPEIQTSGDYGRSGKGSYPETPAIKDHARDIMKRGDQLAQTHASGRTLFSPKIKSPLVLKEEES
eukprot:g1287.t1